MSRKVVIIAGSLFLAITVVVVGLVYFVQSPATQPRTIIAQRRDVIQDVTFTGRLAAKNAVDVSFELTGLVESLFVDIGDEVDKGQELAQLDTRIARLESTQKAADTVSGQQLARLTWKNALQAVETTRNANTTTVEKYRQAVRNAKSELDQAKQVYEATDRENGSDVAITKTAEATVLAKESTYRAAQRTLAEAINATKSSEQAAGDSAALAEAQYLATTQKGPSIAGLSSLAASQEIKDVLLTKSTLLAPITGVVTSKSVEPGAVAIANSPIIQIQTIADLEIVAPVPEIDASKLTVGMLATVTFDVFTTAQEWPATVTEIAPAATIIDGVPTYAVTLELTGKPAENLKPGLTANITVHAAAITNVIAVPRRAIITKNGQEFVRVLDADGTVIEREVTTGLIGSDGAIEVVTGLADQEAIIVSTAGE